MLFIFTCNIHKDAWIGQSYIATFDGTFSTFYSSDIQFKPLLTNQTYCQQKMSFFINVAPDSMFFLISLLGILICILLMKFNYSHHPQSLIDGQGPRLNHMGISWSWAYH